MYMLVYDFGVLEINALKYEDEMQFLEKVRIAQNFNNTVLLDQYAKEKMVRYLQRKNKVSNHTHPKITLLRCSALPYLLVKCKKK